MSFHKRIISGLYFTTFVTILPKLRYFEGRNYIQIGYKNYSVLLFSRWTYERWRHLGFLEREGWSRKGGHDPLYQLWMDTFEKYDSNFLDIKISPNGIGIYNNNIQTGQYINIEIYLLWNWKTSKIIVNWSVQKAFL